MDAARLVMRESIDGTVCVGVIFMGTFRLLLNLLQAGKLPSVFLIKPRAKSRATYFVLISG